MWCRSRLVWIAVAAAVCAAPAIAADSWRKVGEHEFPGWRAELQRVVDTGPVRVAHVCAIVRGDAGHPRESVLLAHFREARSIQGFGRPAPPYPLDDSAMAGFDSIDLRRDVVATEAQVGGSTSRVTRAYVDGIIRRCRTGGTQLVLAKRRR